jgi:hypothetical protein
LKGLITLTKRARQIAQIIDEKRRAALWMTGEELASAQFGSPSSAHRRRLIFRALEAALDQDPICIAARLSLGRGEFPARARACAWQVLLIGRFIINAALIILLSVLGK